MDSAGSLIPVVERFARTRILVVGDAMLDRFVYGAVDRISPEAPIPVLRIGSERAMPGGAANVARNVAALGGRALLVAAAGDDEAGAALLRSIAETPGIEADLVTVRGRKTTVKTRYVAAGQQLLRADSESAEPLAAADERRLLAAINGALAEADALLLSDYAKGVLSDTVLSEAIAAARAAGKPVIADPKSTRLARYSGADVLTPNAKELAAATGLPVVTDADADAAAGAALDGAGAHAILVTRSERGMTLKRRGEAAHHFPAQAREVFDVSGAGDTVLAALGVALAAGAPLADAARIANAAAGIAVGKAGTAAVYADELRQALHAADLSGAEAKILEGGALADALVRWRARGQRVGFTNGCFDLIHPGHVSLLAEARAQCDRLIVGLNSDASVQRLKGPGRPVNGEMARAIVLASLASVDAVVIFHDDTPLKLIEAVRPDVLIKGADYTVATVVGAPFVQSYGGRVHLAALKAGHSTTATIGRMAGGA